MKNIYVIPLMFLVACTTPALEKVYTQEDRLRIKEISDSLEKKSISEAFMDTTGLYLSPIKILSAKIVRKEYSSYRSIEISYKNVGKKKIEAVNFSWYGLDAYGEPADMGGFQKGFGYGEDDNGIAPGKIKTGQFNILSSDAKKVALVWPDKIAFEDGTKWQIH
jgi:hypothetical protein